jgi:hypothetical protein
MPKTKRSTTKRSATKQQGTKQQGNVVTLYVRAPEVWEEARRNAESFDDSFSAYVELALRFFNKGGNPTGTEGCPSCERVRRILNGR